MKPLMEWFVNQIISKDLWDVIGHAIALCGLMQVYLYVLLTRNEVLPDLRGKDKLWQFVEFIGPIWAILFPTVVCAALFGIDIPKDLWTMLEILFFISILGKRAEQLIMAKFGGAGDSKHTTIDETKTHTITKETKSPPPKKDEGAGDDVGG